MILLGSIKNDRDQQRQYRMTGWAVNAGRHHLNAAGASVPTDLVLDTVVAQLRLESRLGGYEAAAVRQDDLQAVYDRVARLLGVLPEDIALVESATVGWQRLLDAMRLPPGARVLATGSTYVSVALSLLELQRSHGISVEVLPTDDSGGVDLDALATALRAPAAFVTASHVPTSSGLIEPVARIGALATAAGVPFVLDATQSVGQLRVNAAAFGADAIFATGRKFLRGPRGTGFLYVSPRLRERLRPLNPDVRSALWSSSNSFELSETARRFETWEASHALRLGLGVALEQLEESGIDHVSEQIGTLAQRLRDRLAGIPGVQITDPPGSAGSGIVTFALADEDPQATLTRLAAARVHALTVPASHGQWDLGERGLARVIRASVHVYNNDNDIDAVEDVLRQPLRASIHSIGSPGAARHRADVVVIGTGIHGRSTAWALARRGISVLQIDQFAGGHTAGSSHGATRMIRRAYPNPIWDGFVDTAYAAWQHLSDAAGEPLISVVGGLFSRPVGAAGLRGPGCREVSTAEAAEIFPGLRLPENSSSLYDPRAGIIRADAAMATLQHLGRAAGVSTLAGVRVLSWADHGDGVQIETTGGPISTGRVVVCAGPWTGSLLPEFAPKLRAVRIVNAYLRTSSAPSELGVFSFQTGDQRLFYGFGGFEGRGLKVGLDDGPPDQLDAQPPVPVAASEEALLLGLAQQYVHGVDGPVLESLSCRYTMAPKNRFAIGAVPGREHTLVAAACSGHGFKFGPAVGEALADLIEGSDRPDLDFVAPEQMLSPPESPAPLDLLRPPNTLQQAVALD
jgi:cysteine desulfurase/selenocysteine lyase